MPKIDAIFKIVLKEGASDLHMVSGAKPMLRVQGEIRPIDYDEISADLDKRSFRRDHERRTERRIRSGR